MRCSKERAQRAMSQTKTPDITASVAKSVETAAVKAGMQEHKRWKFRHAKIFSEETMLIRGSVT